MSDTRRPNGRWVHDHLLSIILFVLFFGSWVGQFVSQAVEVGNEARAHGEDFQWSDFWPAFWKATFENWQSEFLQLFSFVVLTAYFIHKGSHESRDSQDEMAADIKDIKRHLGA